MPDLQDAGVIDYTVDREARVLDAVVNTGTAEAPIWEPNTVEITGQQYHGGMSGIAETHVYDQTSIRLKGIILDVYLQIWWKCCSGPDPWSGWTKSFLPL